MLPLYCRANIFPSLCDFYLLIQFLTKQLQRFFPSLQIIFVDFQFTVEPNGIWLSISLKERRRDADELQEESQS